MASIGGSLLRWSEQHGPGIATIIAEGIGASLGKDNRGAHARVGVAILVPAVPPMAVLHRVILARRLHQLGILGEVLHAPTVVELGRVEAQRVEGGDIPFVVLLHLDALWITDAWF